jgi:hypothetical protein
MRLFLVAIFFVLISCNGQKKAAINEVKVVKSELGNHLELIMQEEQGGLDADEILVIRDAKRLKSFFSKINRTRKPGLPVPDIDFAKDMVIIQCTGEESLAMLSVLKETDTQVVLNAENRSKAKDVTSSGSFCIYKMASTLKEVIVKKRIK